MIAKHDSCLICGSDQLRSLKGYESTALCKCQSCSFVFTQNIPTNEELIHFYSEQYNRTNYLSQITIVRYLELLDDFEKYRKTNKILDVGAGCGFLLEIAMKKGWEVYGTELTDNAVSYCTEKGIKMKKGSLEKVGFDPDMFDIVTCIEVIEHLNNPNEVVEEMNRITRPGGKVYITTPNFNSVLRYRLKSKYDVISYPLHLCYYTKKTLKKLFISHGFKVEKVISTGISLTRIRTSKGKSNQEYVSETSDDELMRFRIEKNFLLRTTKKIMNGFLNIFKIGDSLKGSFIKR